MTVLAPASIDDAVRMLGEYPGASILAGGTDLMVEVNAGHRRPADVIALRNVRELRERRRTTSTLTIGAGATYTELCSPDVSTLHPALAAAARTVGSPQIRNAGTIGGNVATASPAGDTLPVLAALDASIVLAATSGVRTVLWSDFFMGPKRTSRRPDELITAIQVPVLDSRQDYLKVGTRNAMVISVAGLALVVDFGGRNVRCALGSVGPVMIRATEAEQWVAGEIDWDARRVPDPRTFETFAAMVGAAARPIDDHRATAAYRRHAIRTLAGRALQRIL